MKILKSSNVLNPIKPNQKLYVSEKNMALSKSFEHPQIKNLWTIEQIKR